MAIQSVPARARRFLAAASVALLFLPASTYLEPTRINVGRWQRLRTERRVSPDIGLDQEYRALAAVLPARGMIRFHTSGYEDVQRVRFRLQYALAPRRIVTSNGPEVVIEYGPERSAKSLVHDPAFVLTAAPGNDMRVYRRIQP